MPNHLYALDANRHPPQGASTATSGQIMQAAGSDVVSWVSIAGDVSGPPNNLAVVDLTISGQATGSILYYNGTNWVHLAIGTASQVLAVNAGATAPEWVTGGGGGGIGGNVGASDNRLVRSDGVGGVTIQGSAVSLTDAGALSGITGYDQTSGAFNVSGNGAVTIGNGGTGSIVLSPGSGGLTIELLDNDASNFLIEQGSDDYFRIDTTDGSERVVLGSVLTTANLDLVTGNDLTISPGGDTDIQIAGSAGSATAFRIRDGASLSDVYLSIDTTADLVTIGNATTGATGVTINTGGTGLTVNVADNDTAAMSVLQGANIYFRVVTSNSGERLIFGDSSIDQRFDFDGDGAIGKPDASGTDVAGLNNRIRAGAGTGNATPGLLYFTTPGAGSSGATVQTQVDRAILGGSLTQTSFLLGNPNALNRSTTPVTLVQILATDGDSAGTAPAADLAIRAGNHYNNAGDGPAGDLELRAGSTLSPSVGAAARAGNLLLAAGSTTSNGQLGTIQFYTSPASGSDTLRMEIDAAGVVSVLHQIDLLDQGNTAPTAPALGDARLYGRSYAERTMPEYLSELGSETTLQSALWQKNVVMWMPGTGTTAAISFGTSWTIDTTQAHPAPASTNFLTQFNRATFATAATAGDAAGIRSSRNIFWRGNTAGSGGFFFFARVGVEAFVSSMQIQVGLFPQAAIAGEPSAVNNSAILCKDSTDTNWQLAFRDGTTTTKVDLGLAVAANDVLDVWLYAAPNSSEIIARVIRRNNASVLADDTTHTANLPTNTTFLAPGAQVRTTVTTVATLAVMKIYCESDL